MNFETVDAYAGHKSKCYRRTYSLALFLELVAVLLFYFLDVAPIAQRILSLIIVLSVITVTLFSMKRFREHHDLIYLVSSISILVCWSLFLHWDNYSVLSVMCFLGAIITSSLHCTLLDRRNFNILTGAILLSTFTLPFSLLYFVSLTFLLFTIKYAFGIMNMKEAFITLKLKVSSIDVKLQNHRYWSHHLLNPLGIISGHIHLYEHGAKIDERGKDSIIVALKRIRKSLQQVDQSDPAFDDSLLENKNVQNPYDLPEWSGAILILIYPLTMVWQIVHSGYQYHVNDLLGGVSISIIALFPIVGIKLSRRGRAYCELAMVVVLQATLAAIYYFSDQDLLLSIFLFGGLISSITLLARGSSRIILFAGASAIFASLVAFDPLVTPCMIGFISYYCYLIYSSIALNKDFINQNHNYSKSVIISHNWERITDFIYPRVDCSIKELESPGGEFNHEKTKKLISEIKLSVSQINDHDGYTL